MLASAACSGTDQRMQQHAEKFRSLAATAVAVGEAWLGGDISGTYARTALEQAFRLTELERTALAGAPANLADSRGSRLSQSAEQLARTLASMMQDVRASDADSLRAHVGGIPDLFREDR
jgi:hypothetical protein